MDVKHIPLFPLAILPLPGEMIPLHIFEPRYKQLLHDVETRDLSFGILFNHSINEVKVGSLMKLESVIKRYSTGESDIVVKCHDVFYVDRQYQTYKDKLYPGGETRLWKVDLHQMAGGKLGTEFQEYLSKRSITRFQGFFSIYHIAQELNLDINERYQFLNGNESFKESFLLQKLKMQTYLLQQEEKSKDVYHLN